MLFAPQERQEWGSQTVGSSSDATDACCRRRVGCGRLLRVVMLFYGFRTSHRCPENSEACNQRSGLQDVDQIYLTLGYLHHGTEGTSSPPVIPKPRSIFRTLPGKKQSARVYRVNAHWLGSRRDVSSRSGLSFLAATRRNRRQYPRGGAKGSVRSPAKPASPA